MDAFLPHYCAACGLNAKTPEDAFTGLCEECEYDAFLNVNVHSAEYSRDQAGYKAWKKDMVSRIKFQQRKTILGGIKDGLIRAIPATMLITGSAMLLAGTLMHHPACP